MNNLRIFCIIFGGLVEPIYDFCNLLKITNKKFTHNLKSNLYDKASHAKNSYAQKFVKILSENGEKTLELDKYLYCQSGPTERLCEMGCYLLENDRNLREIIYILCLKNVSLVFVILVFLHSISFCLGV